MVDADRIEALGVKPILGDYLAGGDGPGGGLIARHETHHVAHDLLRLMLDGSRNAGCRCKTRILTVS